MKRLIKKAKYYASGKFANKLVEVFINPSAKEVRDLKDACEVHAANIGADAVRGIIADGIIYAWRGDILHAKVNGYLPDDKKIDINQFRFAYEDSYGWTIDIHGASWEDVSKTVKQNISKLNNIGNINATIHVFANQDTFLGNTTLEDIENNTPLIIPEYTPIKAEGLIIFKNPSQKEKLEILDSDCTGFDGTIIDSDIYIWNNSNILNDAEQYIGQFIDYSFSVLQSNANKIVFTNNMLDSWEPLVDLIIKNENKLSAIMNINSMSIIFDQSFIDKALNSTTLIELKNYRAEHPYDE